MGNTRTSPTTLWGRVRCKEASMIITVLHIGYLRIYCHPTRPWYHWTDSPDDIKYFGEGTVKKFDDYMDEARRGGWITGFSAVEIEE